MCGTEIAKIINKPKNETERFWTHQFYLFWHQIKSSTEKSQNSEKNPQKFIHLVFSLIQSCILQTYTFALSDSVQHDIDKLVPRHSFRVVATVRQGG